MNYNIYDYPNTINFIKHKSYGYLIEKPGELLTYCPFCDDIDRHVNNKHGHLYISTGTPVFNCFKCETSGNIVKLLTYLDYDNNEELNKIKSFIKYNISKDFYYEIKNKLSGKINKNEYLYNKYKEVKEEDIKIFKEYIYKRIGYIDYFKYNIYPEYIDNKLVCSFLNYNLELICSRYIKENNNIRYKNYGGLYYIQPLEFNNIDNIILTEGPFDIINLIVYNNNFPNSSSFWGAVCGKNYLSHIEQLILKYLLLSDNITINMIFDKDNKNYKIFLFKVNELCLLYNNNINIKGWIPTYTKDVGEFPICELVY